MNGIHETTIKHCVQNDTQKTILEAKVILCFLLWMHNSVYNVC